MIELLRLLETLPVIAAASKVKYDAPLPLTPELRAEQERHVARIDELLPQISAARDHLRALKETLDAEQTLWHGNVSAIIGHKRDVWLDLDAGTYAVQTEEDFAARMRELGIEEEQQRRPPDWVEPILREMQQEETTPPDAASLIDREDAERGDGEMRVESCLINGRYCERRSDGSYWKMPTDNDIGTLQRISRGNIALRDAIDAKLEEEKQTALRG